MRIRRCRSVEALLIKSLLPSRAIEGERERRLSVCIYVKVEDARPASPVSVYACIYACEGVCLYVDVYASRGYTSCAGDTVGLKSFESCCGIGTGTVVFFFVGLTSLLLWKV